MIITARDCFTLGRGLDPLTPNPDPPSTRRPFGLRCAVALPPDDADDLSDVTYDPDAQVLTLVHSTGDPEADHRLAAAKTTTSRVTDRDGSRPTTPKDFDTDKD